MSERVVARRYASALFGLAVAQGRIDETESELAAISKVYQEEEGLRRLLQHRLIRPAAKKKLFQDLFAGRVASSTLNFLNLLTDKRRENLLPAIWEAFHQLANQERRVIEVATRTAVPLSQEEQRALADKLERGLKKKVRLTNSLDPDLLGGMVLRVGDRVFDGSVRTRLEGLGRRMAGGKFEEGTGVN